jgi:hypothetical protein
MVGNIIRGVLCEMRKGATEGVVQSESQVIVYQGILWSKVRNDGE